MTRDNIRDAIWVEVDFKDLKDGNDGGFHERSEKFKDSTAHAVHKIFVVKGGKSQYPRLIIEVRHSSHEEYFGPSAEISTSSKMDVNDWWSDEVYFPMSLMPVVQSMISQFIENVEKDVK